MSPDAWDVVRPRFEAIFGSHECDVAGGHSFAQSGSSLFGAIDDYARANGPTDDLLTQLAPAAGGDLILVLVEAGSLPPPEKVSVVRSPAPAAPGSAAGRVGGLSTFSPMKQSGGADHDVLQLSASLFSVALRRSVASLDMEYSGNSVDEAVGEFVARVARLLPAATCKGWNWQADIDPQTIRSLLEK